MTERGTDRNTSPPPGDETEVHREEAVTTQLHYVGGEELPMLFANHIFIRAHGVAFYVAFAQSHGPWEIRADPERLAREGVNARIVSSLALTADKWKEMLEVAVRQYDTWARDNDTPPLELTGYERIQTSPEQRA